MKTFLFSCFSLLYAFSSMAQCPDDPQPIVIINEVGNFGRNAEYIELLVIGYPNNPYATVDMTDWILDDNSVPDEEQGNEPGHLRFGDCLSAVEPGTLILIYNPNEIMTGISSSGDGTTSWGIQISAGSGCITGYEDSPNHVLSSYSKGSPAPANWQNFIPLRNDGDVAQLRDATAALKHAVMWGGCSYNGGGLRLINLNNLPNVSGRSIQFTGGKDWFELSQYAVIQDAGSPGLPNSADNEAFILALKNKTALTGLAIECSELQPATNNNADGMASITVSNGQHGYNLELTGPVSQSIWLSNPGTINIENLLSGMYSIVVTDANGCSASCDFIISKEEVEPEIICQGGCVQLGTENTNTDYCYTWYPMEKFTDPHLMSQEVCPEETSYYTVVIVDEDGNVIKTKEYMVEVTPLPANYTPKPALVCPGGTLTLDAGAGYDTYQWKEPAGNIISNNQTATVSAPGAYELKVTKETCSRTIPVIVEAYSIPDLSVSPASATLCNGSITLTASPEFVSYTWYAGSEVLGEGGSIYTETPGTYHVIATDENGCTRESDPVEINQGISNPAITPGLPVICANGDLTLDAGAGYETYIWKNALGAILSNSQTLTVQATGEFHVEVTGNGCSASASVFVEESKAGAVAISPPSPEICLDSPGLTGKNTDKKDGISSVCSHSIVLTATPGALNYIWSTGASGQSVTVSNIGTYSVTATDGNACSAVAQVEVNPCLAGLSLNISPDPVYLCNGSDPVILDAGPAFASYEWSTGETSQTIAVTSPGAYNVTVSSSNGTGSCFASDNVTVKLWDASITVDLEIYKPRVLDLMESIIPEGDETGAGMGKGSMTFVNVDNDDTDSALDQNDKTVAGGDDELVKLKLKVSKSGSGTDIKMVKLIATKGGSDIVLWKSADKSGGKYKLGSIIECANDEGTHWTATLWIEAIKASTVQQGVGLKLICNNNPACSVEDNVDLTILGVSGLSWTGMGNGFAPPTTFTSNTLDADPNFTNQKNSDNTPIAGKRVFPDGHYSALPNLNDKAKLKIELSAPPVYNVDLYVKAFDIDDPSESKSPVDPNDKTGAAGTYDGTGCAGCYVPGINFDASNDNRGTVIAPMAAECRTGLLTDDTDLDGLAAINFAASNSIKSKEIEFRLSFSPGDNFRAAAYFDPDFVRTTRNRDQADGMKIIDPSSRKEIIGQDKYYSEVLTVWRIMHLEADAMDAGFNGKRCYFQSFNGIGNSIRRTEKLTNCFCDYNTDPALPPNYLPYVRDHRDIAPPDNPLLTDLSPDEDISNPNYPAGKGRFENGSVTIGALPSVDVAGNGIASVTFKRRTSLANMAAVITDAAGNTLNVLIADCIKNPANFRCTLAPPPCPPGSPPGCVPPPVDVIAFLGGNPGRITIENGPQSVIANLINPTEIELTFLNAGFTITDDDAPVATLLPYNIAGDPDHIFSVFDNSNGPLKKSYILCVRDIAPGNTPFRTEIVGIGMNQHVPEALELVNGFQNSRGNEADENWITYLVIGFESGAAWYKDCDPDAELTLTGGVNLGLTVSRSSSTRTAEGGHFTVIPLENFRDASSAPGAPPGIGTRKGESAFHEIMHQFGLGHVPGTVTDPVLTNYAPILNNQQINFLRCRKRSPGM